MKISEALSTGVLIFGGLLFLKALGGVQGLTNIFSGIGNLFGSGGGGGGSQSNYQAPGEILTGTAELEAKYDLLSAEAQKLALEQQSIQMAQQMQERSPAQQYMGFMEQFAGWVPIVGDIIKGANEQVEFMQDTYKAESYRRYMEGKQSKQEQEADPRLPPLEVAQNFTEFAKESVPNPVLELLIKGQHS